MPLRVFPAEVRTRQPSAFLFPTLVSFDSYCKQASFSWSFQCHVFTCLWFVLVILLFKIVPKGHTETLSSVSKCTKAVRYLTEKIRALEEHSSGLSSSDFD